MIGTEISHYRILSRLGRGGMGEVYLAQDLTLDRKTALKFLPANQTVDESARKRLEREAHSAARLDHPFICKIYEVVRSDDRPFIAMEYVEGLTLREELATGALPLPRAIRIASELAEALDLAHQRGIVHRDLKPSNVMLTPDGHVKVMDFGLAKQVMAVGDEFASIGTMTVTQTGDLAGTLAYMSPEQLRATPIDARSDVFAFGLLFHEMVTGVHPFRRPSPISTTDAILNEPEPPLDDRVHDAPPLLAHLIGRCLAKDREHRYQSMRDVRIELNALAGDSTASSRRPIVGPRRQPRWWAAAAIAGAVAIAAVAVWRWPIWPPFSQRQLAFNERDWIVITDFENLTGDAVFDRSLRAAFEVGIAQSQFVNVFPPARVQDTLRRMQKPAVDRLDEPLASEIAAREGVRAVFAGSIAQVGEVYSLTARVIDPHSRQAVLTESVQASGKNEVLPALDRLATRVRRSLGESLAGISRQRVPLPNATTSSLEALKMYADGLRLTGSDAGDAGSDLLRQAVALDPDFALAHAELGRREYLQADRVSRVCGRGAFREGAQPAGSAQHTRAAMDQRAGGGLARQPAAGGRRLHELPGAVSRRWPRVVQGRMDADGRSRSTRAGDRRVQARARAESLRRRRARQSRHLLRRPGPRPRGRGRVPEGVRAGAAAPGRRFREPRVRLHARRARRARQGGRGLRQDDCRARQARPAACDRSRCSRCTVAGTTRR